MKVDHDPRLIAAGVEKTEIGAEIFVLLQMGQPHTGSRADHFSLTEPIEVLTIAPRLALVIGPRAHQDRPVGADLEGAGSRSVQTTDHVVEHLVFARRQTHIHSDRGAIRRLKAHAGFNHLGSVVEETEI